VFSFIEAVAVANPDATSLSARAFISAAAALSKLALYDNNCSATFSLYLSVLIFNCGAKIEYGHERNVRTRIHPSMTRLEHIE
jgi:hypothetical protein